MMSYLITYTRKLLNLFICLALQQSKNINKNIYLRRFIIVSFPKKSYHTKTLLCSNINVSLNLYMYIKSSSQHRLCKN